MSVLDGEAISKSLERRAISFDRPSPVAEKRRSRPIIEAVVTGTRSKLPVPVPPYSGQREDDAAEMRSQLDDLQVQVRRLSIQRELQNADLEQERQADLEQIKLEHAAELERLRASSREELEAALAVVSTWIDDAEAGAATHEAEEPEGQEADDSDDENGNHVVKTLQNTSARKSVDLEHVRLGSRRPSADESAAPAEEEQLTGACERALSDGSTHGSIAAAARTAAQEENAECSPSAAPLTAPSTPSAALAPSAAVTPQWLRHAASILPEDKQAVEDAGAAAAAADGRTVATSAMPSLTPSQSGTPPPRADVVFTALAEIRSEIAEVRSALGASTPVMQVPPPSTPPAVPPEPVLRSEMEEMRDMLRKITGELEAERRARAALESELLAQKASLIQTRETLSTLPPTPVPTPVAERSLRSTFDEAMEEIEALDETPAAPTQQPKHPQPKRSQPKRSQPTGPHWGWFEPLRQLLNEKEAEDAAKAGKATDAAADAPPADFGGNEYLGPADFGGAELTSPPQAPGPGSAVARQKSANWMQRWGTDSPRNPGNL